MTANTAFRWTSLLFSLAALTIAGCDRPSGAAAPKEAPRVTVAHPLVRTLTDEADYNGWLEASQTQEVRARVRGHIEKVLFKDGDMVQKGQLLFELDPRPFQVALDATLADAKALDAQRIAAERDVARQKELLKSQAVAVSDYEKALADAHSYTARIAAKNQEAEKFRLDLEYSRVTAAISGRIGRAMLTEGNLVNAGGSDPLLATIVAVNPIYVDFNIDERALQVYQAIAAAWQAKEEQGAEKSLRELNLPFSFGLETESGFPHQGRLLFAENKVAADTGTIFVRGEAANRDRRLVPGFRVRVRLAVGDKYTATLVPEIAVNTEQTKKYLLMVGPDKIVKRQDVELGRLLDDGMRVVKAPKLSADALIVIEGMAREHYPVEPVLPSGATAK